MAVRVIGRFYDGKSGAPYDVGVETSSSYLNILLADGMHQKRWAYSDIEVLEDFAPPQPAKLTSKRDPVARLLITSGNDWQRIKKSLPKATFRKSLPIGFRHLAGYAFLSVFVVFAVWFYLPKIFELASYLIPRSIERKLGETIVASTVHGPVCVNPAGQKALDKIIKKLETGTTHGYDYTIVTVKAPEISNALSAPGQHLILYSGIIDHAGSGDEIAGVLAHELAHGELRHTTRGIMRDIGFSLVFDAMFGGQGSAGHLASFLGQMNYNRADELAADAAGQDILENAHLNPQYMTRFFERLEKESKGDDGPKILVYLSTHPLTAERITRLKTHKKDIPGADHVLTDAEWHDLQQICDKTESYQ